MPLPPQVCIQLHDPGEFSDGSKTKITKQHKYDKVTDIWARWYTANTNAKSQSALEITHSMSLLYDHAWWIKGTDITIISMQGNSAIYTPSYNVVGLIVTLGAAHCMDTCTHY